MIAMLRYAFLKSLRDGALVAFLIFPSVFPAAALMGVTIKGHFRYPLYINAHFTPVENADLVANMATVMCAFFALIPAFWTFRPEIASRSIGSFYFAVRPLFVTLSLILFAAAVAFTGFITSIAEIVLLTAAWPSNVGMLTVRAAVGALATSALGALVVSISAETGMVVVGYVPFLALIAFAQKSTPPQQLILATVGWIVCVALSTFLLERRCAT